MEEVRFHLELGIPYAQAVEKVTAALKEEGFGVLTEIDVKATMQKKIGAEYEPYVILGACNPEVANEALSIDRNIGIFMPCNVVVYEKDDGSVVDIMNPGAMVMMSQNAALEPVAQKALAKIRRVVEAMSA